MNEFKHEKETSKVLNLGCGNAEMSEDMYADGYINISNIDISENVIEQMKVRNKEKKMTWEVMDVMNLSYSDNSFDLVVDKSTIDAILCGESSFINVSKMIKEVDRVLKVNGIYMIISYGQPENRLFHLEREHLNFDTTVYTIKKDYQIEDDEEFEKEKFEKTHFVYVCKKIKDAPEDCKAKYDSLLEELLAQEKLEEDFYKLGQGTTNSNEDEEEEEEHEEKDKLINSEIDEDKKILLGSENKAYTTDHFDDLFNSVSNTIEYQTKEVSIDKSEISKKEENSDRKQETPKGDEREESEDIVMPSDQDDDGLGNDNEIYQS
eukprot:CAMPEP_0170519522 /NCGR_PEP_ID=MMETSP0209-20121228/4907_1 /TAXON_ID=665100 ORGANISM="Litonotus pictus, Strain P1" /NCGR_SAMPLE_ID=MMETSP0209 /ASSEMBLY_ACC=CAM_ASM_000301 /LENGTH=320 /DNA_ID=CAMNT_0010805427 /DNA_START=48 /DNA_END=1007 /DNA_ORIENTATION=-